MAPATRLRLFFAIYLLVVIALVLPAAPPMWSARLVLGVPVSFLWVFATLVVVFASVLWLYRNEEP